MIVLTEKAHEAIRRVVAHRLVRFVQDIDDVCNDAVVHLLSRDPEAGEIADLPGYAAITAHHACDEYFRRKFPQRHRLKNRLRYLLKPERQFALWASPSGVWLCGYSRWQTLPPVPVPAVAANPSPEAQLRQIFDAAQGPVPFEALIDAVARLWGVADTQVPLEDHHALITPRDERDQRASLQQVWQEIRQLPVPQRLALLLNLRSADQWCPLRLLPATGIASIRDIAATLEMAAEELAALWNKLPLDDNLIAHRLQITRQQVINLRKSARKRLERRTTVVIPISNDHPAKGDPQ
jgi:RNA polymerase sigma factor (sigma-70 family)